jgi:hypothetical protein
MHWEFSFTPTESEQLQALRCVQARLLRAARGDWRMRVWGSTVALLAGAAGFAAMVHGDGIGQAAGAFFLYGMLGALLLQAVYAFTLNGVIRKTAIAADPALYTGPRSIAFDENAVILTWNRGEMRFRWDAVTGLDQQGDIFVVLAGAHYLIVPDRVFATGEQRRDWLEFVQSRLVDPPPGRSRKPVSDPLAGRLKARCLALFNWLWTGVRLAALQPVRRGAARATPGILAGLLLVWVAIHLAADFAASGLSGRLAADGLPGLLYPVALITLAAALAAALGRCIERLADMFACLLAIALPLEAVVLANQIVRLKLDDDLPDTDLQVSRLAAVWLALAGAVALARLQRLGRPERLLLLTGMLTILSFPLYLVQPFDSLWTAPSGPDESYDRKYDALTSEDAFYQQPKLLDRALAQLRPQTPGVTDLYFIGVGGDAEQGVFLREVKSVGGLIDARFGTADRTVTLINNYHGAMDYPLASVTALERSIQRIGELMDKDNDILFLFLTSHGSRDHRFVLDFWPLKFKPLDPAVLRGLLDKAGIKWRVIVVSACYSGGYIEPLQSDNSIVITAAAADKTSFGCADENDWTYFGRAFFQDALDAAEGDLDQAFAKARSLIAEREAEEGIDEASDPQIASGPAMRGKWQAMLEERREADTGRADGPGTPPDLYDDLITQLRVTEQIGAFRSECEQQMAGYAPAKTVEKKPAAYGGLTPESQLWPDLVEAWERYVDTYCRLADEPSFRKTYAQAWRESAGTDAASDYESWLTTPAGRNFIEAQQRADRLVRQRVDHARLPAVDEAMNEFQRTAAELAAKARQQGQPPAGGPGKPKQ